MYTDRPYLDSSVNQQLRPPQDVGMVT